VGEHVWVLLMLEAGELLTPVGFKNEKIISQLKLSYATGLGGDTRVLACRPLRGSTYLLLDRVTLLLLSPVRDWLAKPRRRSARGDLATQVPPLACSKYRILTDELWERAGLKEQRE
jgi:hypothetical protein